MKITALLPMKAHSSRVPGKNFKLLHGKPLYRWILDSLLDCVDIESVVINTDARRELEDSGLMESSRVRLRERPHELCGDEVSMNRVLENDLANTKADYFLMTHTTNPIISSETIERAIACFSESLEQGFDSLFSVNRFQTRFYRVDGSPINHDPALLIPTQDLEPWFEENSCLYLFSKESFKATDARIGLNPVLFETPKMESIDIDEPEDWDLAERVLAPI